MSVVFKCLLVVLGCLDELVLLLCLGCLDEHKLTC